VNWTTTQLRRRHPPLRVINDKKQTQQITAISHRPENCAPEHLYADLSAKSDFPTGRTCLTSRPRPNSNNEQWVYPEEQLKEVVHQLSSELGRFGTEGPKIYAVTGTNGKSSVVELTRQLHDKLCPELHSASIGTLGCQQHGQVWPSPNTTPYPLDLHRLIRTVRDAGAALVALEASSHGLDQDRLCGLPIEAAAITNLGHDHLDYHDDLKAYHRSKLKLCNMSQGPLITTRSILKQHPNAFEGKKPMTVGIDDNAQLTFSVSDINENGFEGKLCYEGENIPTNLKLWGRFNLYNTLIASAFAMHSGCSVQSIASIWPELSLPKGRLQLVESRAKGQVRIDYAHSPDALEAVLQAARQHRQQAKLKVLLGCGGDRDPSKRPLMAAVAQRYGQQLYVTSDNPRSESPQAIIDDILKGLELKTATTDREYCTHVAVEVDRRKAIHLALADQEDDDLLLICGKGHENEQITLEQTQPFDEFEICRKF
jgi:UDP-N-acetylmuramoyl-L-alanyl-D-glutamate--2,6-diaminopimelate ligase